MALLDHDDLLSIDALYWVVEAINRHPDAGIIYSDEDKIDEMGNRKEPYFKSEWNRELFLGHNLISHLGVYRMDLVRDINGFRMGYEGAQDYDLAARIVSRIQPYQIIHIPFILYHWRILQGSTAMDINEKPYALRSGERALNEFLESQSIKGKVKSLPVGIYRFQVLPPLSTPSVTIIIPTRNKLSYLKQCVESILRLTTYNNYNILIVDNGSDDPATLLYLENISLECSKIEVIKDSRPFNYAAMMNSAVEVANGDWVALLNNDTEIISPDWLTEMVGLSMLEGVGAVGAKLWYKNKTLQHGGIILGLGEDKVAGHMHHLLPEGNFGYFGRAYITQELSAVSAACLVVKKQVYKEVNGFDEDNLSIAFNDVDFCLKLKMAGYRNLWAPYAELYHYESISRGSDQSQESRARYEREVNYMKKKYGDLLLNDSAYSPNLSLDFSDFSMAWPPRVRKIDGERWNG
jgi:GT2 family glycosyltransferase